MSTTSSPPIRPISIAPIGIPAEDLPAGMFAAGCPVMFTIAVNGMKLVHPAATGRPPIVAGGASCPNGGTAVVGTSSRSESSRKF